MVLATNAYSPQLGYFSDRLMALHSHVIATEAMTAEARAALGWPSGVSFSDDFDRLTYANVTDQGRILIGGGNNRAYDYVFGNSPVFAKPLDRASEAIRSRFDACFPRAAGVATPRAWSGALGVTGSRVPLQGVRGSHRNIFYSVGYSGSGVTAANLAGRILTDIYAGEADPWLELPGVFRRGEWLPPEPFRWLGYVAYTTATGRSRRRVYRG